MGTRTTIGKIKMKADGGQGAAKMDETSIIGVVRGYLEDRENSYDLMWENLLRQACADREPGGG